MFSTGIPRKFQSRLTTKLRMACGRRGTHGGEPASVVYDTLETMGVNVPVVMAYDRSTGHKRLGPEEVGSHFGVRIDYEESAGKQYCALVMRTAEGGFVTTMLPL
jgi:hypothetical protein